MGTRAFACLRPDGQEFLVVGSMPDVDAAAVPITMILNWPRNSQEVMRSW